METMTKYTNHPTKTRKESRQEPAERDSRRNPNRPQPPDGMLDLPDRPRTGSPVPWLTSIHATNGRGGYGDARYRGNCSGLLIRDLLCYYRPKRVLDPMCGGGTCPDVCAELGIESRALDIKRGFDAANSSHFRNLGAFDFIWLHPPYWRMIHYNEDPRCLSNAASLEEFLSRLQAVIRNCLGVLSPRGHLAILMGDGKHEGEYLGLPFHTLWLAKAEGLWLAAPEIIRFSHGASSSTKQYQHAFIPRLHDVCLVLHRRPKKA
jgi:SAM-dependent methyltransferase